MGDEKAQQAAGGVTPEPETGQDVVAMGGEGPDAPSPTRSAGDLILVGSNCVSWIFAGAMIVAIAALGILLFRTLNTGKQADPTPTAERQAARPTSTPTATATATPTPTTTPIPTPTPDVILLGIETLGELNTVQYNLKTVVDKEATQKGPLLLRPHVHLLLVAEGRVKAGVDFREMIRYEIQGTKVRVLLPAPRITDFYIDASTLRTYYIRNDWGLDEKFVVARYEEAVVEAQESLRKAALESGILDVARTNATALVQSLILGLGFSEVEVTFLPPQGHETMELEMPLELIPTLAPFPTATSEG